MIESNAERLPFLPSQGILRYDVPWRLLNLDDEVQTPEKRLEALLNILQNGAQTLTILAMESDTSFWSNWYQINKRLNSLASRQVVCKGTTKKHLISCIEPVGFAAKSTIDDSDWALTEMGIAAKPALLFGWMRFLESGIDPMAVLSSTSNSPNREQGARDLTPAMARWQIFNNLFTKGNLTDSKLRQLLGLRQPAVQTHIEKLSPDFVTTSLLSKTDALPGELEYIVKPNARDETHWPTVVDGSGKTLGFYSNVAREAVLALDEADKSITLSAVTQYIKAKYARGSVVSSGVALSFFAEKALLEVRVNPFYEVSLTDRGKAVFQSILQPLGDWSRDRRSIQEITRIDANLKVGHSQYKEVYSRIANMYIQNSPIKNADHSEKKHRVLALITETPGSLTQADVARRLRLSTGCIHSLVRGMLKAGEVKLIPGPGGSKYLTI